MASSAGRRGKRGDGDGAGGASGAAWAMAGAGRGEARRRITNATVHFFPSDHDRRLVIFDRNDSCERSGSTYDLSRGLSQVGSFESTDSTRRVASRMGLNTLCSRTHETATSCTVERPTTARSSQSLAPASLNRGSRHSSASLSLLQRCCCSPSSPCSLQHSPPRYFRPPTRTTVATPPHSSAASPPPLSSRRPPPTGPTPPISQLTTDVSNLFLSPSCTLAVRRR
jgi:hypothetical protein